MERRWLEIRNDKKPSKRVLVIGGGPAGMSAALSAEKSGHQVTLLEASSSLGGQVAIASTLKMRSRLGLATQQLEKRVLASSIDLRLNTFATDIDDYLSIFEKIIVATGSTHLKRKFGAGIPILSSIEAIEKYRGVTADEPKSILVFDEEGTWVAGSIAEELASNGFQVHLVSPTATLFSQITMYSKLALIPRLKKLGVKFHLASEIVAQSGAAVIKSSINDQLLEISSVEAIIDCPPKRSNDELYQGALLAQSGQILLIGDALAPRTVAEATFEGNAIGAFLDLDLALRVLEH